MNENSKTAPYSGEELMEQAKKEVGKMKLPEFMREDAESEYVLGALEALRKEDRANNVRAWQRCCGRNAMLDFLRREIRHERLAPGSCHRGAERVSLDLMVPDEDGRIPLGDAIPDPDTETRESPMEREENESAMKADVRRALESLDPALGAVAMKVLIEGMTQEKAAEALGITRMVLRTRLDAARLQLQEALSGYRDEFNRTRFEKDENISDFS